MKRPDLLHAVMLRARAAAARDGIDCELRGVDVASPGEYVLTAWGTPGEVVRLTEALGRDDAFWGPSLVEELGQVADAGRRRHLHIAVVAPSLW